MKKILAVALCAGATLAGVSAADASGGCGQAFHRGPDGFCHPNHGYGPGPVVVARGPEPVVVVGGGPAIGVFYSGHGYWDGHRYWGQRYWGNGGWRYR